MALVDWYGSVPRVRAGPKQSAGLLNAVNDVQRPVQEELPPFEALHPEWSLAVGAVIQSRQTSVRDQS